MVRLEVKVGVEVEVEVEVGKVPSSAPLGMHQGIWGDQVFL